MSKKKNSSKKSSGASTDMSNASVIIDMVVSSLLADPAIWEAHKKACRDERSGRDWLAGLYVDLALARGAPLGGIIRVLSGLADTLPGSKVCSDRKVLNEAIRDLLEGRWDARHDRTLHSALGLVHWNSDDNFGGRTLAQCLYAAVWLSMDNTEDGEGSIAREKTVHAAHLLIRGCHEDFAGELKTDADEMLERLRAGLDALVGAGVPATRRSGARNAA